MTIAFASCNEWLDVSPTDKTLEKDQFASEDNINSATNGLYRQMTSANLYGGQLSQTTLEFMAHYYTYPPSQTSDATYANFYELGTYNYTSGNTRPKFTNVWKEFYQTILHINSFIKGMNESTAVMSQEHKNILLGEAYALRAYLHFDLFRIYGPIYQDRASDTKILPYNDKTEIVLNHTGYEEEEYTTAENYMQLVLADVTKAEELLKNDPVITDDNSITDNLLNDNFYKNRNRRMNFYAVKGLEARVRQYIGDDANAALAAKVVTDQMGKRFKWVSPTNFISNYDYIFFSEVIFGINNMDMSSRARTYYLGNNMGTSYVVDYNNLLKNIFEDYDTSLGSITDIRSKQWSLSNVKSSPLGYSEEGTYISYRYSVISTKIPAITDLQPLMRVSEMYYIQAEAALKAGAKSEAVKILNDILRQRGLTDQYFLANTDTDTEILAHITREYYREFFGEGQVFFFHKRHRHTQIFSGHGAGNVNITNPAAVYVIPIPDEEKNI
jgi:hypothetical protein